MIPEKGTTLARGKCGCCGEPVNVKTDKRGLAYFICTNAYPDNGEPCGAREWFSRRRSRQFIEAWQKRQGEAHDAPGGVQEPANVNAPPTGEKPPQEAKKPQPKPAVEEGGRNGLFGD